MRSLIYVSEILIHCQSMLPLSAQLILVLVYACILSLQLSLHVGFSTSLARPNPSRLYHRITNNGLHDLQSRAYESTTAAKPPTTLSIRSLVRVHLHRLPLTIGGKVVDINPPSLSHELPCQTSRCNWLPCGGPHHPSKEGTRKLCCRTFIYMYRDIHVHSKK